MQAQLARPRLGYCGVIDERINLDLIAAVAHARPDWEIVMVGPTAKVDPAALPHCQNIHWLGQQSYDDLPSFISGWDVCLMPFALNESTRFISPTKTLEYMAAGKPVVSTPIADVSRLYAAGVRIAATADEFIAACDAALAESETQSRARRAVQQTLVDASSWDATAASMFLLMQRASIAADRSAGFIGATSASPYPTPQPGMDPAARATAHIVAQGTQVTPHTSAVAATPAITAEARRAGVVR